MRNKVLIGVAIVIIVIALLLVSKKSRASISASGSTPVDMTGMFMPDMDLPRGVRNNNPGNLRIAGNNWQGKVPEHLNSDGDFEQFWEYKYGIRAMIVLLTNYMEQGDNTIVSIITRYAPPSENNTNSYINSLSNYTGFDENEPLAPTKETLRGLVKGIAKSENGYECVTNSEFNKGYNLV